MLGAKNIYFFACNTIDSEILGDLLGRTLKTNMVSQNYDFNTNTNFSIMIFKTSMIVKNDALSVIRFECLSFLLIKNTMWQVGKWFICSR